MCVQDFVRRAEEQDLVGRRSRRQQAELILEYIDAAQPRSRLFCVTLASERGEERPAYLFSLRIGKVSPVSAISTRSLDCIGRAE